MPLLSRRTATASYVRLSRRATFLSGIVPSRVSSAVHTLAPEFSDAEQGSPRNIFVGGGAEQFVFSGFAGEFRNVQLPSSPEHYGSFALDPSRNFFVGCCPQQFIFFRSLRIRPLTLRRRMKRFFPKTYSQR
jgi:hypothetical protein